MRISRNSRKINPTLETKEKQKKKEEEKTSDKKKKTKKKTKTNKKIKKTKPEKHLQYLSVYFSCVIKIQVECTRTCIRRTGQCQSTGRSFLRETNHEN
jgi:hypothetical protein